MVVAIAIAPVLENGIQKRVAVLIVVAAHRSVLWIVLAFLSRAVQGGRVAVAGVHRVVMVAMYIVRRIDIVLHYMMQQLQSASTPKVGRMVDTSCVWG